MEDDSLRPLPVNLDELAIALTSRFGEYGYYFDLQTGEILFLPQGLEDYVGASESELAMAFDFGVPEMVTEALQVINVPLRFVFIWPLPSWQSYNLMEDFIYTLPPGRLRTQLERAISKRKPFRRFKDVLLNYPEERQAWFDFQNEQQYQWARDWLAEHGIRPIERNP